MYIQGLLTLGQRFGNFIFAVLCMAQQGVEAVLTYLLVYVVTTMKRDGRVARVTLDGASGKVADIR